MPTLGRERSPRRKNLEQPLPPLPAEAGRSLRAREKESAVLEAPVNEEADDSSSLVARIAEAEETAKNLKALLNTKPPKTKRSKNLLRDPGLRDDMRGLSGIEEHRRASRQRSTNSFQQAIQSRNNFVVTELENPSKVVQLLAVIKRDRELYNKSAREAAMQIQDLQTQLADRTQQFVTSKIETNMWRTRCLKLEKLLRDRSQVQADQSEQKERQDPDEVVSLVRSGGIDADESRGLHITVDELVQRYSAPDVTGESILQVVRDINEEIETIATAADPICERRSSGTNSIPEPSRLFLLQILGEDLYEKVKTPTTSNPDNWTWSRLAIKALLCHRVFLFQQAWPASSITRSPQWNQELLNVYKRIQRREPQQIAALWRAVMCRHMRFSSPEFSDIPRDIGEETKKDIVLALILSGAKPPMNAVRTLRRAVEANFDLVRSIDRLWERAGTLAKMTKEQAMWGDFQLLVFHHDMQFDIRKMDEAVKLPGRARVPESSKILCTTQLGLTIAYSTTVGGTDDGQEREPMGVIQVKAGVVCKGNYSL